MKHIGKIVFIIICLAMCALPSVGMIVRPTNTTTENKELARLPDIKKNGKWNINFLQELGNYFEDHFAFRQELVSADAEIQSKVFKVSNVDTVVVGSDGWLYYSSTVDDYLRKNVLSERCIKNIAHNLSLVQQYVQDKGAKFIFTVAPNKNSLYGENMPFYLQKKAGNIKNIDMLENEIEKYNISYVDLFALFEGYDEELYLKRDSHWNQKGAVFVYNALLDRLNIEHDSYTDTDVRCLNQEYGDLNKMLYPLTAKPEQNYFYQKEDVFSYKTDTKSVEDAWIETQNSQGTSSLLMFRDSFGNTLLPLMANVFANGYFSKGVPQNIAGYIDMYNPEAVIFEKVERNISELAQSPPVIESVTVKLDKKLHKENSNTSINIDESKDNADYLEISGIVDASFCEKETNIYVKVSDVSPDMDVGIDTENVYKTLYTIDAKSDYGYKLYIPKEKFNNREVIFDIIIENKGTFQIVKSKTIKIEGVIQNNLNSQKKRRQKKSTSKRKVVSREKVYDCDGSGHGYSIITWSDGEVEYKDF